MKKSMFIWWLGGLAPPNSYLFDRKKFFLCLPSSLILCLCELVDKKNDLEKLTFSSELRPAYN